MIFYNICIIMSTSLNAKGGNDDEKAIIGTQIKNLCL